MTDSSEKIKKSFFDDLFDLKNSELYKAVDRLIEEGSPDGTYYTLLILSSIIIAAGNLLANGPILIGGMLVTPLLSPVLLVALAITAAKPRLLKRTAFLILKSSLIVLAVSFLAGLLFGVPSDAAFFDSALFNNSIRASFLYFVVAFISGIAATISWVRKDENSDVLPGIAIAVSLVPPLSLTAIWLSVFNLELMRFYLLVFLFNLFGIVMGSLIIFSMLKVYRTGGVIEKKVKELDEEEEIEKREKAIKKAADTIIELKEAEKAKLLKENK